MESVVAKEARKQYLRYFRFWFLAIGILAVICIVLWMTKKTGGDNVRTNGESPAERVYDYAAVLTEGEAEDLRRYIKEQEQQLGIDIVILTINQPVEGDEAVGQGLQSRDWGRNMQALADDFWDENRFGYNKPFEGDGILLISNWYEGQEGETLSTSGKVEWAFSTYDIDSVLDAVYAYIGTDPYRAYKAYVDRVGDLLDSSIASSLAPFSWVMVLVLPVVIALVYAFYGLHQKNAENTVAVNAYVAGGKPVLKDKTDTFLRKNVVTKRIETNSGGGNRARSSGGGGHHRSSSGASHGGGGRRR